MKNQHKFTYDGQELEGPWDMLLVSLVPGSMEDVVAREWDGE